MSKLLEFISGLLLVLCILANEVQSTPTCKLKTSPHNPPLITQQFGSKVILLTKTKDAVEIDENTSVQAYCQGGFSPFNVYTSNNYNYRQEIRFESENKPSLVFKCLSNQLYVSMPDEIILQKKMADTQIECIGSVYSMFESRHKLAYCENYMSYVLGVKTITPIIIAGVCYDLDKLSLKYVSYKLHEPSAILDNAKNFYPVGLNGRSLTESLKEISHFFKFPSDANIENDIKAEALTNFWLRIANYELGSIVQSSKYYRAAFNEFGNFFNTIWWRNLRLGNWQRFMELLEKRSEEVVYNIYAGTSGAVQVPVDNMCQNETSLVIHSHGKKKFVPQFIWTYLYSTDENAIEKDFVAIAYNSPYYEYFEKNATMICKDMCDEIGWLIPMQDSRNVSSLGVFYCCRPEEVIGLLDGFPLEENVIMSTTVPTCIPEFFVSDYNNNL